MTIARALPRVLPAVAVVLLVALAWTGLSGSLQQFSETMTIGQRVQAVAQLVYGVLSLLSIVTWFWARQYSWPVFVGWVLSLGVAGGLATVVWGDSSILTGVLAGVASVVVAVGVVWLLRFRASDAA